MRLLFGSCVLDSETRELRRAGEPVHLTPKAFELLQALLEGRPRVLPKTELSQRLWPDTHVLEANLPNLVAEVRGAVGDDARNPRFIRTVHGFGYAFCGEAVDAGSAPLQGTAPACAYQLLWNGGVAALTEGEYVLGRDADSVITTDAATVSRRHARLRIAGGEAVLDDLGSRNGTFVRGERLSSPARLVDGDQFRLGSVPVTFRVVRAMASLDTRDL